MLILAIIIFVLILSTIVLVHEAGHFLAARRNGVKVEEFGVGYPPRAIGWYKDENGKWKKILGNKNIKTKNIIWSINWIPFGGFVKMLGEEESVSNKDSYSVKSPWQRAQIIVAGVVFNFLFAWVALTIWFWVMPENVPNEVVVSSVEESSAAADAGIMANDYVLRLDGIDINSIKELKEISKDRLGKETVIVVKRFGKEIEKTLSLPESSETPIGVGLVETGLESMEKVVWWKAPYYSLLEIGSIVWMSFKFIWFLILSVFGASEVSTSGVSGPVGVFGFLYQIIGFGASYVLRFAAILSIAVGFFNILPIPALDGGHLFFIVGEAIFGRKMIKEKWQNALHLIGFSLLMIMFVVVTYNDIVKLIK